MSTPQPSIPLTSIIRCQHQCCPLLVYLLTLYVCTNHKDFSIVGKLYQRSLETYFSSLDEYISAIKSFTEITNVEPNVDDLCIYTVRSIHGHSEYKSNQVTARGWGGGGGDIQP